MTLSSDSILIKFDQTQSKQKYISPTNDLGSEIFIGQQFNPTFQQLLNSKYDVFNASLVSVGLDGQEVLEREEAFENKLDKGMKTLCSQGTEFDQQFENINIDDENNSNKQNFPKSVDQAIENSKKMLIQTDQELQYPIGLLTMIEQNNLSKDSAYETRKSKQTQAKMKGMRILQKIMLFKRCSTIFSEAASNIRKVLHKDQERVRAIPNLQKKSLLRKQGDTSPVHVIWGMIPSSSGLTNERDKLEYQNYYQEEDVPFLIRDLNFSAPLPLHLYSQEIIQRVIGIQRRISAQAIMDEMKLFAQTLHFSSADCVEFSNSTPFCETGHKSNIHEIDKDQSQDNNDIFGQDEEDETWEPVDGECGNDGKKLINVRCILMDTSKFDDQRFIMEYNESNDIEQLIQKERKNEKSKIDQYGNDIQQNEMENFSNQMMKDIEIDNKEKNNILYMDHYSHQSPFLTNPLLNFPLYFESHPYLSQLLNIVAYQSYLRKMRQPSSLIQAKYFSSQLEKLHNQGQHNVDLNRNKLNQRRNITTEEEDRDDIWRQAKTAENNICNDLISFLEILNNSQ